MAGTIRVSTAGESKGRLASRSLLAVGFSFLAATVGVAGQGPRLDEVILPRDALLATDGEGHVLVFDPAALRFDLWTPTGILASSCALEDSRLRGEANAVALSGSRALVSFFDAVAEQEDARRLAIVDVSFCTVVESFSLPDAVMWLAGARDGWLVVTHPPGSTTFSYLLVNNKGKTVQTYSVPKAVADAARDKGLADEGAAARLVAVRQAVWMLPSAIYGLAFPRQHGRGERFLLPPDCLAATGRRLAGLEAEQELRRRVANADERTRQRIEAFIERSRAGSGSPLGGYVGAVSAVAANGPRLAVAVRDARRGDGGCRLDVWDTTSEAVVVVRQLPFERCPGFVALASDGAWLATGDRLVWQPLPADPAPAEDLCAAARVGLERAEGTAPAATRP